MRVICYNFGMEKLNLIIAKNLSELRRQNKLTQLEVAEKLNYSDKAVSKWEQGESLPGIEVLYKLAKLYGVSMDYIVGEEQAKPARVTSGGLTQKRKRIITLLSVLGVWLLATVFYIFFDIFAHINLWTLFCWAVPASFVVSIVFDAIWHKQRFLFLIISAFIWSLLLCFCLQFVNYNIWLILGIGVPLQLAVLLCAWLVKSPQKENEDGKTR